MEKTVRMALARSTKGTHIYEEEVREQSKQTFPTIYVKKQVFGGENAQPPANIEVTIKSL